MPNRTRYEWVPQTAARGGRNYKKWQLKHMSPVGKFALGTFYRDPDTFCALLHNCRLQPWHGSQEDS